SLARARRITMQMLSGLAAAHDLNIVHRDLKPANVMLTRMGAEDDWVKVLDFGIGKAIGTVTDGFAAHNLTETGEGGYGTPRYMAPEQIRNKKVGPHTDVYAVGLMMLEMLTGRPAIAGETTYEVLANQITEPIMLPDELAQHDIGLVLARAAAKDFHDRYATAREFYDALAPLVVDDVVLDLSSSYTALPSVIMETGRGSQHRGTSPALRPVGGETGQQLPSGDVPRNKGLLAVAVIALAVAALIVVALVTADG